MERHLDEELAKLNTDLLTMATLSEEAIHKSVEALKSRDKPMAQEVIENDKKIDELEIRIEEHAIEILALFQPMAKDLRFLTTGMRINTDLERIADMAVNISQRALELSDMPLLKPLIDIPKLAENAKRMVRDAIDAFVKHDEELAKNVILSDKESNRLRTLIMHELINDYMVKDGSTATRAVPLLLIARDLERISDHATNIAEEVIYMIQAKVVKHHLEELIFVYKKVKDKQVDY
jgi:phosphate transport system protein